MRTRSARTGTWWGALWRGERSLAFVFWALNIGVHVVVNAVLAGADAISASTAADPDVYRGPVDAILAAAILLYVLWTLLLIPITWRTAGRHGGRKVWATLARCWAIVVPAVLVLALFAPG